MLKRWAARRLRARAEGERGAALVETAILIPVIVLITFGLIEFSSAYQSQSVATGAVRSAARTASAEALLPTFATDAAAAAATALRTIGSTEPKTMWIYRANASGLPESGGFTSCTTHCISYSWNSTTRTFDTATPGGSGWPYNTQNACNSAAWDSVGVYVKLTHPYITKLFGASIDLTDHAVFRLEPAPTQLCP
jgi:Flp pilus assembly protein TadG